MKEHYNRTQAVKSMSLNMNLSCPKLLPGVNGRKKFPQCLAIYVMCLRAIYYKNEEVLSLLSRQLITITNY